MFRRFGSRLRPVRGQAPAGTRFRPEYRLRWYDERDGLLSGPREPLGTAASFQSGLNRP